MKTEKILKTTTSRSDFNRAYKVHLEHGGKIGCAYCRYHKGENSRREFYRKYGAEDSNNLFGDKSPSWKLASKNRKQWMNKNKMKVIDVHYSNSNHNYKRILVRNDY